MRKVNAEHLALHSFFVTLIAYCVCVRARRRAVNANAVDHLATSIINRMRIEHRMREWRKNRMKWAKQLLLVVSVLPHVRTHISLNCSTMPPLSHFISFSFPSSCVLIVISISSINNYFNPLNSVAVKRCCRLPSFVLWYRLHLTICT